MDAAWSAEDLAFRDEVRAFLDAELTPELRRVGGLLTSVYAPPEASLAWQRILNRRGWAAPGWPVEHGGCGWSASRRYLFGSELARACAPPLSPMGIGMCGPVLIGHGTPEQQRRFLPRLLSGEDFWCQGYSEPGSGSDLASLSMKAVDSGDHLICTGHKLWTTFAHVSNWMFCLVRTAKEDRPQKGITFLLIDMTSPGVEVRPIPMLTGEHIQNDVFFTEVRVPKANVVGTIGEGWTVAKYLMAFERGGQVVGPILRGRLARIEQASGEVTDGDARPLRSAVAEAACEVDAIEAMELRMLVGRTAGQAPGGAQASLMKVRATELSQRLTEIALDLAGPYAAPFQPHAYCPGGPVMDAPRGSANEAVGPASAVATAAKYFNDRAGSIYGGTNEIQRNILAKAMLAGR